MRYQTTRPIKSLANGGISLGAMQPVSPHAFLPAHWQALLDEGVVIPLDDSPPARIFDATKAAADLAKEHGIDLATVNGSGTNGRITLGDVKALVNGD